MTQSVFATPNLVVAIPAANRPDLLLQPRQIRPDHRSERIVKLGLGTSGSRPPPSIDRPTTCLRQPAPRPSVETKFNITAAASAASASPATGSNLNLTHPEARPHAVDVSPPASGLSE
jgi:hypothetical protein